jgi:hypothetical protein
MSIRIMANVFSAGKLTSTQKLVMLSLADFASDDGRHVYPSVNLLVQRTSLSERAVRKTIGELRALGLLVVVRPSSRHAATEYRIDTHLLADMQASQPDETPEDNEISGRNEDSRGAPHAPLEDLEVHQVPVRGAPHAPLEDLEVHQVPVRGAPRAPNPSINHQIKNNPSENRECDAPDLDADYAFLGQFLEIAGGVKFSKVDSDLQISALLALRERYGDARVLDAARWAWSKPRMTIPKAIRSIKTALPGWNDSPPARNTSGKPDQSIALDVLDRMIADERALNACKPEEDLIHV